MSTAMQYISTRGGSNAPALNFTDTVLAGLAPDGGLYLPQTYPKFTNDQWQKMADLSYAELAATIMHPFVGNDFTMAELQILADKSYQNFNPDGEIAPIKQLDDGLFLLELFHGPTLAFKDFALQFLGHLFDAILQKQQRKLTIIGATSGDTGSAAINAFADKDNIDIFMLHPKGKISPIQEAQMTSILSNNVYNIALEGSFDDCQDSVKALFNDAVFRERTQLSAVNSINWARIMAQIVYYAYAILNLGCKPIAVAVPSGNFGNIFAAWVAKQMGLPIEKLIIGSNENDILTRTVRSGIMATKNVVATISPSMDIQISSNFERLLFELTQRDAKQVTSMMQQLRQDGTLTLPANCQQALQDLFAAESFSDAHIIQKIADYHTKTGEIIDPHSMIGVAAGTIHQGDLPVLAVSTAHPAKFAETIARALNMSASQTNQLLPAHLQDLATRPQKSITMPYHIDGIKNYILASGKS